MSIIWNCVLRQLMKLKQYPSKSWLLQKLKLLSCDTNWRLLRGINLGLLIL
ncbi:hypothetical protein E1A91_D08G017300v1 [Gossypium mustelinum]|uniref:Uncharacterized protein n=1 Tax=Gossypium mustelinum TaxID=34275 RepID=A0A5D2TSP5_GOSMU|nr:hypothetical protein E1A91_D08G017300v1 [Gossypium mustelinum]